MEELTDRNGYLKASNADGTAIFEAVTDWCSNCKAIAPFIDKMIKKYPDARFYSYNTDTAHDIAQELSAHQMPTFHVFKDGDLRDSVTGAKAKEIEAAIASNYDGKVNE
ncbi:Putative Thioredoxin domain-containing protein [Septoria linicola]|uniref:Thioredoxin domain-containing protein n=1 Tax=Septoria linicola TaxID=215465 RepID=A0A9Q9ADR0_9PEZI|nr:putative Thioredoxin domain-containing protein [Septoria linicola]USW47240.1 Putative Thioredoxin domain-containing protein [Septoria linicola]